MSRTAFAACRLRKRLKLTSVSSRALARESVGEVHAGPIVLARVRQALVDVELAVVSYRYRRENKTENGTALGVGMSYRYRVYDGRQWRRGDNITWERGGVS